MKKLIKVANKDSQPAFTYSMPTMETPEQCVKFVQS